MAKSKETKEILQKIHDLAETIPVNSKLLTQLANIDTVNVPKFVCLNIRQNWAAKNINTNSDDKSFK